MLPKKRAPRSEAPQLEHNGGHRPLEAPCFPSADILQTCGFKVAVPELAIPSPP